jgi:hypothetical protein
MMFEHRVQSNDLEIRMFEKVEGALRLRRSVRDASGTQHLERMQFAKPVPACQLNDRRIPNRVRRRSKRRK